jgi:hypothetical protein
MAAISAGALLTVSFALSLVAYTTHEPGAQPATSVFWIPAWSVYLLAHPLVLLALVGLYTRQSVPSGALGLVGFLTAFFGGTIYTGITYVNAFAVPAALGFVPEGGLTNTSPLQEAIWIAELWWVIGLVLFAVAIIRAHVLPRGGAILLAIGALVFFVPVIFGAALAWLGSALWSEGDGAVATR